jgi:hypothetical protein
MAAQTVAVTILLGAIVLSAVFSIEAKRNGRLVLGTYLTHAAANTWVFSPQLSDVGQLKVMCR